MPALSTRCGAEFFGTFWLVLGGWALQQLWLFWVAPLIGGVVGALLYRAVDPER